MQITGLEWERGLVEVEGIARAANWCLEWGDGVWFDRSWKDGQNGWIQVVGIRACFLELN